MSTNNAPPSQTPPESDVSEPAAAPRQPHWHLFRDVAVFQAKLLLDGLRDLLMSPVSLVAALVGLLTDAEKPDRYFKEALGFGRRTEQWINLFGTFDEKPDAAGADDLVHKMEKMVIDQYNKGGLTASAKEVIDRSLHRLHENLDRRSD